MVNLIYKMSSIIQLLPDHVANQIAAGEVVQRPASVVKELLENAVDAKATDIKLIIKEAGKTLVQVIDNGVGMSVTDARLCFERHATSKIRLAEDLFSINTKGFRGEALASIAAIAHVEMKTRQDQDELGSHLIIEGSKFVSQEFAVVPKGTSFSVKNLFYNIPARRNFLKSDSVEIRHVIDEFQRVAMAHCNISFTMYHNGNEMFNLPQSNLRQRIVNIFAGKTNEKLVPIGETTEIVTINGFVSKPEFAKKSRGEQFFFVNNRYIKSGYLHHAIIAAFDGLLKDGSQPSYFIYLDVPPHSIDINIHPTKTEIKFDDEHALYAILRSTVKHSLGQFNVVPALDFDRDATLDTPYHLNQLEASVPTIQVDRSFNPFGSPAVANSTSKSSGFGGSYQAAKPTASWESMYVGLEDRSNVFVSNPKDAFEDEDIFSSSPVVIENEEVVTSLFQESDFEKKSTGSFQIHKKYIVNPIKSGMVIIDQQRAHQRVLYEEFLTNITVKQASSQQLLFPIELYFSKHELLMIQELKETLHSTGFVFEAFYADHVTVSGIPVNISESEISIVIEQLIHDLQEGLEENSFSQFDRIAKSMARSLAVKTGTQLTQEEQEHLINGLFACKDPNVSPFMKPIFITMNVEDLDKNF